MPKTETIDVANTPYPEFLAKICDSENPLTVAEAKALIGWTEEKEKEDFGNDFDLYDLNKQKIRLSNNQSNRPFDKSNAKTWMSEILNKNWKLNGETLIIGNQGTCLDCQHRLVALILAAQEIENRPEEWESWNNEEPTLPCVIIFGVSEDDATVNTINTGKPRSFSDVVFRSKYFEDFVINDRKKVSKILEWTVKFVAHRTGAFQDAYATKRTHSELVQFVDRHPTLILCAKHIFETNGDSEKLIKKFIPLGSAAGLLYLMAVSKSDPNDWKLSSSEDSLNLEHFELAKDFWSDLAENNKKFANFRKLIASTVDETGCKNPERVAFCVKAWLLYSDGKPMTKAKLALKYSSEDSDGFKTLIEHPVIGCIDFGSPEDSMDDLTPEEISQAMKTEGPKPQVIENLVGAEIPIGSTVWVVPEDDDEPWSGELVETYDRTAKVKVSDGFAGAGNTYETQILTVQTQQPKLI